VVGIVDHAAYCATQGGVNRLTRVMALEWSKLGVTVKAVGPTSSTRRALGHVNGEMPLARKSYGALAQRTPCESWRLPGPVLPRSVVIKVSTSCQPPPR
jgi:NAD(P)-dependent dehydrogenase (short-subunit alcohol dehydrogenase family)